MILAEERADEQAEYDATGGRKTECGVPVHGRTHNKYAPVRRRAPP